MVVNAHKISTTKDGTKVGQSSLAYLGFFGTTPVARPTAVRGARGAMQDLGILPAGSNVNTLSANGAVTIADGINKITKAGVCALTLAAPTAAQEGTTMVFSSTTANAHTITATGLINDGVTGGSKNAATFAAFAGATITLVAIALKWHVQAANNVAVA